MVTETVIPPTIGRVVLVYCGEEHVGSQWNTAQICYVHDEETNGEYHPLVFAFKDSFGKKRRRRKTHIDSELTGPYPLILWSGIGREDILGLD